VLQGAANMRNFLTFLYEGVKKRISTASFLVLMEGKGKFFFSVEVRIMLRSWICRRISVLSRRQPVQVLLSYISVLCRRQPVQVLLSYI
jgi:hypothetical protein